MMTGDTFMVTGGARGGGKVFHLEQRIEGLMRELQEVKTERDAAVRAAFLLGQMDMRESAAAALTDAAAPTKGVVHGTMMAAVEIVNNLKTI